MVRFDTNLLKALSYDNENIQNLHQNTTKEAPTNLNFPKYSYTLNGKKKIPHTGDTESLGVCG